MGLRGTGGTYIRGTFDLVGLKIVLKSLAALVSICPVTLKRGVVEGNRLESGTYGICVVHIHVWGSVDLIVSKVVCVTQCTDLVTRNIGANLPVLLLSPGRESRSMESDFLL